MSNYKLFEDEMTLEEAIEEFDFFNEGDYITRGMSTAKDVVLQELENTRADLYEANHRITDLLLTLGDRDRLIDLMARVISNYDAQLGICEYKDKDKDDVIEAFKDFDKRINIRKKKREEFKDAENKS
jgi:hypothetical protein